MSTGAQFDWRKFGATPEKKKQPPHTEPFNWSQFGVHETPGQIAPAEEVPEPVSVGGFLRNIPRSTGRLIGGVAKAITSPVETAKGLQRLAEPFFTPTQPAPSQESIEAWLNMTEMMKERYGDVNKALITAYEDPAGVAADISLVATGVGGAAGAAAKIPALSRAGRVGAIGRGLERTGKAARVAAETADPLRTAARLGAGAVRGVTRPIRGKMLEVILGKTTGQGPESIRIAKTVKPGTAAFEGFQEAMRGGLTESDILGNFRSALEETKAIRGRQYRAKLETFAKNGKTLDISSLRKELSRQLDQFNIKRTPTGELDFSRSTISAASEQTKVAAILDDVYNWGKKKGDRTPLGIDTLKRRLDDFYSESGQARALVRAVHGETRKILNRKVPGYAEMTREYAVASELIEGVEKGLSLKGAQAQTAIRKLQSAMKENKAMQRMVVDSLEKYVGDETLMAQLAGHGLSTYTPHGIVGALSAGTIIGMVVGGVIRPEAIVALATHSPRAVGELILAMSAMEDAVRVAGRGARPLATPGAYRALQAPEAAKERELLDIMSAHRRQP